MSTVVYIQSAIRWEKNLVSWITEDRRKSSGTAPAVACRGDDGPKKTSVKTSGVMSEIRIGNLLEASEKHEAEMIFTYI